jgi:hypothetical protein
MIITYSIHFLHWLPKKLGVAAITLGSRVYVAKARISTKMFIHELEHILQWRRGWYVGFAFKYALDYGWLRFARAMGHQQSYEHIRSEKAAWEAQERFDTVEDWADANGVKDIRRRG